MSNSIEDYAVIGNCETLALVGRDGSIDWLGFPDLTAQLVLHRSWAIRETDDGWSYRSRKMLT